MSCDDSKNDQGNITILIAGPGPGSGGGMFAVAHNIGNYFNLMDRGVRVIQLDTIGGRGKRGYLHFPGALFTVATAGYDLLHLNVASKGSTVRKVILAMVARIRGKPYVIHLHGGGYTDFLSSLRSAELCLVKEFFEDAGSVIVLGDIWAESIMSALRPLRAQIAVVPNGVPGISMRSTEEVDACVEHDRKTVVFIGPLSRSKGIRDLVSVAESLLSMPKFQDWEFLLVGPEAEPDLIPMIHASAARVSGRIRVLGAIFGIRKANILAAADVFVLPSYAEAFPLSMLEAMSCGTPCVCTSVGAVPEVIVNGVSGLTVAPGDVQALEAALAQLMADDALRRSIGDAGQKLWSEQYTLGPMCSAIEGVWRACLK